MKAGVEPEVLAFRDVTKRYVLPGGAAFEALRGVSMEVRAGRVVALIGRSGSGKSTFLHLAAGLDAPTGGAVRLLGRELAALSDRERTLCRRDGVGLVFQFFHLLPHLSVTDNVLVPALIGGGDLPAQRRRAEDLLARVGLADRAAQPVQKLSGGEMQRVALCRAVLRRPRLLLADEPTGELDASNERVVLETLRRLPIEHGCAVVVVTHSDAVAKRAHRTIRLRDGEIEV